MTQTNIEGSIMDMLEPKVKDIQEKFSKGEKLSLQDFNLLLLKTQYNHLNHLDQKLDEVVANVGSLKGEFNGVKVDFNGLRGEFNGLRGEFKLLEAKFDSFKSEIKLEISNAINKNMMWSIGIIAFIVTALKVIDMILK